MLKKIYSKSTAQLCDSLLHDQCKLNKVILLIGFLKQCLNICPKWLTKSIYI